MVLQDSGAASARPHETDERGQDDTALALQRGTVSAAPRAEPAGLARQWLRQPRRLLIYVPLAIYAAFSLAQFFWVLMTSLKTQTEFMQGTWTLPQTPKFENYLIAWERGHIGQYFFNSVFVCLLSVAGVLLVSAMAAYALARIPTRFNTAILFYFLAALMIPGFMSLVPFYFLVRSLHLDNSLLGLSVLYIAGGLVFDIFILTGFFKTLPSELEEAAAIDGASAFGTFWRIMLPLAKPGLLTVAIFNFIAYWNEYFIALIFLRDRELFTLTRGLQAILNLDIDYPLRFAALLVTMVPILVVFMILQDQVTEGLTIGALKG